MIDLSHNSLRKWDSKLFDLENLSTHNKLQALPALPPKVFQSGVGKLEILDLAENELSTLPALFFCCNLSIRSLKLEGNRLQRLHSGDFRGLSCYEDVFISRYDEVEYDSYASKHYTLKWNLLDLKLGGNRLTTLPGGLFNGFTNLLKLQLQSNQLVRLPQQLFQTLHVVHGRLRVTLQKEINHNLIFHSIHIFFFNKPEFSTILHCLS